MKYRFKTSSEWKSLNMKILCGERAQSIEWFDKMGILQLDNIRNVEITLDITHNSQFDSYKVEIHNKISGEVIARHRFLFNEHRLVIHQSLDSGTSCEVLNDDFFDLKYIPNFQSNSQSQNIEDEIFRYIELYKIGRIK